MCGPLWITLWNLTIALARTSVGVVEPSRWTLVEPCGTLWNLSPWQGRGGIGVRYHERSTRVSPARVCSWAEPKVNGLSTSTRVPPEFHQGSSRVPPEFHRVPPKFHEVLQGLRGGPGQRCGSTRVQLGFYQGFTRVCSRAEH